MDSLDTSIVIKNCKTGKAETTTDYKKFVFRMLYLARAEQLHLLKDVSHEAFIGHMDELAGDIMKGEACLCGIGSIISDLAKQRINAVANEMNSASEEVEKLTAEIMTLKATPHPSMTSPPKDCSDYHHELKREIEELTAENKELLEALKQKSVDCGEEIDELKKENEELTDELNECVDMKDQLKEEYEELEKRNEKLEAEGERNDEVNEQLTGEIEELKKEIEIRKEDFETLEGDMEKSQEAYREKDEECDDLMAKIKDFTDLHPSPHECYDKIAHIKECDENVALHKEKKELLAKILAIKNVLICSQTGYND